MFNSFIQERKNSTKSYQSHQKQSSKHSNKNKLKSYINSSKHKKNIKLTNDSCSLTCSNKTLKITRSSDFTSTIVYEKDEIEKKQKQKQNALKIKESLTKSFQSPKKKKKYLTLDERHQKMTNQLYDKDNEYSLVWHEGLLRKNHSRKFKVIGFSNGVPTLGIQPITSEDENEDYAESILNDKNEINIENRMCVW